MGNQASRCHGSTAQTAAHQHTPSAGGEPWISADVRWRVRARMSGSHQLPLARALRANNINQYKSQKRAPVWHQGCELRPAAVAPAAFAGHRPVRGLHRASTASVLHPTSFRTCDQAHAVTYPRRAWSSQAATLTAASPPRCDHASVSRTLEPDAPADGTSWHEIAPAFFQPTRRSHVFGWYTISGS